MNRRNTDDLQGSENTLSDIMYIMVDLLVQTHRICTTKSEPDINYGPWVIMTCQSTFINCNIRTTQLEDTDNTEGYACVGDRE